MLSLFIFPREARVWIDTLSLDGPERALWLHFVKAAGYWACVYCEAKGIKLNKDGTVAGDDDDDEDDPPPPPPPPVEDQSKNSHLTSKNRKRRSSAPAAAPPAKKKKKEKKGGIFYGSDTADLPERNLEEWINDSKDPNLSSRFPDNLKSYKGIQGPSPLLNYPINKINIQNDVPIDYM